MPFDEENKKHSSGEEDSPVGSGDLAPLEEPLHTVQGDYFDFKRTLEGLNQQENAPATYTLIGINVLVFVVMVVLSGGEAIWLPSVKLLQDWGAGFGPLTLEGEYWRILTACFLHIGIGHLLMNMFVLWDFGVMAEKLFGTKYFLILYLLSGLAGACVSLIITPVITSAGASGAIFGVIGAVLGCYFARRKQLSTFVNSAVRQFALTLIIVVAISGISFHFDNGAHFGGMVTGFLCGIAFAPAPVGVLYRLRFLSAIIIGGLVFGLFQLAKTVPLDFQGDYKALRSKYLIEVNDVDRAIKLAEDYMKKNPEQAFGYRAMAEIYTKENRLDKAVVFFDRAIGHDSNDAESYAGRAYCELHLGNYSKAIEDATRAIGLDDKRPSVYYVRMMALSAVGEYDRALADNKVLLKSKNSAGFDYLIDRAEIYWAMDKASEALLDLNSVIDKYPRSIRAIENRAYLYYELGRHKEAFQEVKKAGTISPLSDPYIYLNRAYAGLVFDDSGTALSDSLVVVTDYKDQKSPFVYAAIVGTAAAKQLNDKRSVSLVFDQVDDLVGADFWPYPILSYMNDKLSEEELISICGDNKSRLTEAYAFVGFNLETEKHPAEAAKRYQWVVEQGNKFFLEYDLAKTRLMMLEQAEAGNSLPSKSDHPDE